MAKSACARLVNNYTIFLQYLIEFLQYRYLIEMFVTNTYH